jgi:hypothetical protein
MLVYLTGTENIKRIENAIYEIQMDNNIFIGEPIKSNSIDLLQEVKTNLCKNKEITTLLIDLSVIINIDEDIIKAIKTLRFYNNECKFIIVATDREIGDSMLSEMVNMGIYNIIVDDDEMMVKIKDYTLNNGTYKEASVFQKTEEESTEIKKQEKRTKAEKIKNTASKQNQKVILKTLKGKITISIIGTQTRIGVTHTSILMAYNLMKKGYRVAVVEYNANNEYNYLADCYEHSRYTNEVTNFLKIYQIDFYSNVNQSMLSKIQGLSYDYIIIDNGDIDNCDMSEHNRADVKIVIFGSKAWEQHNLSKVFEIGEEIINNYRYLTICDEKTKKDIMEEMKGFNVKFLNFKPEPFSEDEKILDILEGYLYEESNKKKSMFSRIFK